MGVDIDEIVWNLTYSTELFNWPDFGFWTPSKYDNVSKHSTPYIKFSRVFSHAYAFEKSNKDKHLVDVFEIEWNIGLNTFHVLFRVFYVWINRDLIRFWSK